MLDMKAVLKEEDALIDHFSDQEAGFCSSKGEQVSHLETLHDENA
jgi:hypothetical protein